MPTDFTIRFFVVVAVGAAIGLAGLANLLTPRLGGAGRFALSTTAAALPLVGLALIQSDFRATLFAAGSVASLLLLIGLMGVKSLAAAAGHRVVRWAGLTALGIGVVVYSGIRYDGALDDDSTEKLQEIVLEDSRTPLEFTSSPAVTDHGHAVPVQRPVALRSRESTPDLDERQLRSQHLLLSVIRLVPADDVSNCHGWVFAGGQYWIGGTQVDPILDDNDYHSVSSPKVGDLVVYRESTGTVIHSGIVRATPEGLPAFVESKWGSLGVFLHPMDQSPYGTDITIYRSSRTGHLLAGLSTRGGATKTTLP